MPQKRGRWALKNGQCQKIPEVHRENCSVLYTLSNTCQLFYKSIQQFQNPKVDPSSKLSLAYSGFTYLLAFCIFGRFNTAFSSWLCLLWVNRWMYHSWLSERKVRSPEAAARVAITSLLNLEMFWGIESPLRASAVWKAMELCQEAPLEEMKSDVSYFKYEIQLSSLLYSERRYPSFSALRNHMLLTALGGFSYFPVVTHAVPCKLLSFKRRMATLLLLLDEQFQDKWKSV